jgi:hypothetical protein
MTNSAYQAGYIGRAVYYNHAQAKIYSYRLGSLGN